MPEPHRSHPHRAQGTDHDTAPQRRRRELLRIAVVLLSLLALLLTSSALNWVTEVRAADEEVKKAVVVSGPVHSLTDRFKGYAKAMADAAEAQGMKVIRIFHPNATKGRVKKAANGAHLFIYVGHGNGWPSPYGPFQERTKNGLGLNPDDPDQRTTYNVLYKGADWLKANIRFAPNAVVILSHLSYASGNASSGMAIPTRSVAVERIDNFANGFLASGARVVWALGWQPGADVIQALHREDATMDAIFMTRYREPANPLNGWIGQDPGYYASVRTPGAEVHIDPHPSYGYLRGLTGDLSFTTMEWRNAGSVAPDVDPPVISGVSANQAAATVATGDSGVPIFTPNGDGISDTIAIRHTLSESAFLDIRITKGGNHVRRLSVWSLRGTGITTWDGRRDDGKLVGEGTFRLVFTPTDRAGNVGEPADVRVKVLSALRKPSVNPHLFDPTDGDGLASTSALKARLTKPGTVSWTIRNGAGNVVRHGIDEAAYDPGNVRFVWDGTDDDGRMLPQGKYTARVRVTRPQGSYGHDVVLRMMPFKLKPTRWTLKRGDTIRLRIDAAEPVKGRPIVTSNQPGIKKVQLNVRKVDDRTFKTILRTRKAGRAGDLKVRIVSQDKAGGSQSQIYTLKLR